VKPVGYIEAFYAYNFAQPSNGITNYRGYDNRHNTFSLTNAALGAGWEAGAVTGKLVLQIGSTPSTYYLAEPRLPGTNAANATGPDLWKYLQEAHIGWTAPIGGGLLLEAGLFLAPIGPEVIAVKDNWHWSSSNLSFAMPTYHTGIRAVYKLTPTWAVTLAGANGWNSVVDSQGEKLLSARVNYIGERWRAQLVYLGGSERPGGAPEGQHWRNTLDSSARFAATPWLSLQGEANGGFEETTFGTASWYAGVLYGRLQPLEWLYLALRGEAFRENVPSTAAGAAEPIFWGGATWVSEGTVTMEVRPADRLLLRVEYRHDHAERPLYFRGTVAGDGGAAPFVPNTTYQDTLTIGATSWF
jgi:hypothetical protein